MRPSLKKEILRGRTAYRVGRTLVDVILILELGAALVFTMLFIREELMQPWAGLKVTPIYIAVGLALLYFVAVILQRELLQAVFDIADGAVEHSKLEVT